MIVDRMSAIPFVVITATVILLAGAGGAQAAPPVKLKLASHISSGFESARGVAVAPNGNLYITDEGHQRVQELTPAGEFVLMFGREVNATTHSDICTEEEIKSTGVKCQAGVEGEGARAFKAAQSITVDPSTDNVYVQDQANWRVDEYTSSGEFVLMFGKEVNETTKGGVCTAASHNICKAGVQNMTEITEHGAFNFAPFAGNLLAVGGPEHLVYVGDEHGVQEFDPVTGVWKGEVPLTSISAEANYKVAALALDGAGDLFLAYGHYQGIESRADIIREFNPGGAETDNFTVNPRLAGNEVGIVSLALDSSGHLAMSGAEAGGSPLGSLFDASTGQLIAGFAISPASTGLAFSGSKELYAAEEPAVLVYKLLPVAEAVSGAPVVCAPGPEHATSVTFGCTLTGKLDPYKVAETTAWFQYGTSEALVSSTPPEGVPAVNEFVLVKPTVVEGLRPNQIYYYRLAAEDENTAGEPVHGDTLSFTTLSVAPKIVCGQPEAFNVAFSSAVFSCALNPEKAKTVYRFQYGPCGDLNACAAGALQTLPLESPAYGVVGVMQTATGLAPSTTYHYRLTAENEHKQKENGQEGSFMTLPAPSPTAATGLPEGVTSTSATLTGTVDPGGAGATYSFQVGVYNGASTVYSPVVSGSAGAEAALLPESFTLTGLQPGVTYAYQVAVSSAYGTSVGEPVLFTTVGLPTVLFAPVPLVMLPVPHISFPKPVAVRKTKIKTKKSKHKKPKKPKKGRKAARRSARKTPSPRWRK